MQSFEREWLVRTLMRYILTHDHNVSVLFIILNAFLPAGCMGLDGQFYPPGFVTNQCLPLECKAGQWVPTGYINACCEYIKTSLLIFYLKEDV